MNHIAFIRTAADKSVAALKKEFAEQYRVRRRNVARRRSSLAVSDNNMDSVWGEEDEDDRSGGGGGGAGRASVDLRGFSFAFTSSSSNNNNNPESESAKALDDAQVLKGFIRDLREEEGYSNGKKRRFRRVFVRCDDSGDYEDVGWILSNDVDVCMACTKPFQGVFFSSKHHCRACGNVICDACSLQESVDLLERCGPQRVCRMCFFDQSPVQAVANISLGHTLLHGVEGEQLEREEGHLQESVDELLRAEEDEEEDRVQLTYWHFGEVSLCGLHAGFVLRAHEQSRELFINICGCDAVPQSSTQSNEQGQAMFPLVVGERATAANGSAVRDVAFSEYLVAKARFDSAMKAEIAAEALSNVVRLGGEKSLRNFSYIQQDYLPHNAVSQRWDASRGEVGVLAIPAPQAFTHLTQMATRLADAVRPLSLPAEDECAQLFESLFEASVEDLRAVRATLAAPCAPSGALPRRRSIALSSPLSSPFPSVSPSGTERETESGGGARSSPAIALSAQPSPLSQTAPAAPPAELSPRPAAPQGAPPAPLAGALTAHTTQPSPRPPLATQRALSVAAQRALVDSPPITQRSLSSEPSVSAVVPAAPRPAPRPAVPRLPLAVQTSSLSLSHSASRSLSLSPQSATGIAAAAPVPLSQRSVSLTLKRRTPLKVCKVVLLPRPGFVVKTRLTAPSLNEATQDNNEDEDAAQTKVFVNVFQHEIADKLALDMSSVMVPEEVFVMFTDKSFVEDKAGAQAMLLSVCVGASHFAAKSPNQSAALKIVSKESVGQILQKLSEQIGESLDAEQFVLPRVKGGVKGALPTQPVVFRYLAPVETPRVSPSLASVSLTPRSAMPTPFNRQSSASPSVLSRAESIGMSSVTFTARNALDSPRSEMMDAVSVATDDTARTATSRRSSSIFSFLHTASKESSDPREGERLLTKSMMDVRADMVKRVSRVDEETIRRKSLDNPQWLVGYHITVFENTGIKAFCITTGWRHRRLGGKTEFRISVPGCDDRWVRLKRASHKSGLPFTINFKVSLLNTNNAMSL